MNKKGGLIVDSNMVDGAGFLATFARLSLKTSVWDGKRGTNLLDGGCPYYSCYECKDLGKYVAVGALEPQFFQQLLHGLDLDIKDVLPPGVTDRSDKTGWTFMKKTFESKIKEKTRDEWEKIFEGVDACVTPVKEMVELENEGYRNKMPVHVHDMLARDENGGGHPDDGIGWIEEGMSVGENAEQILGEWLGWEKEVDWREVNGTLVKVGKGSKESKL
ncbi:putative alpha-methylacylracemase [Phaeomoniella chlamydospora]|uniref:Putative alpha-methylacylracemase n=1 Tax=Phaeomoniella chlamydospora TaxID=158046 RepID=A0A0G2EK95_PHACM|nr:putative alpha-methylacylracemase [Phaeomoniella chlamydospora]